MRTAKATMHRDAPSGRMRPAVAGRAGRAR